MNNEVSATSRIASIDIMRGVAILLMMLDHVRERFYMHMRTGDPIHETIDPDLFFTRYLAYFCAPAFIFLAGLSAWLYSLVSYEMSLKGGSVMSKKDCPVNENQQGGL